MPNLHSGAVVAGYRLADPLGKGGYGEVWRAVGASEQVAIKFLRPGSALAEQRFAREVGLLQRLNHPNVVRLLGSGVWDGRPFLVMEFIDGAPLHQWMSKGRSVAEKLDVARQICEGLRHAHASGVLHRDLKPANIMVRPMADGWRAVLVDLGIGKLTDIEQTDITKTGEIIGTPGFMSPEQLHGRKDIDAATDVYALGATLYVLFEERAPFDGDDPLAIAMNQINGNLRPMATSLPGRTREVILQTLAGDPARRPTVDELLRSLGPNRRWMWWLAIALLLACVVASPFVFSENEEAPAQTPARRSVDALTGAQVEPPPAEAPSTPAPTCTGTNRRGTFSLSLPVSPLETESVLVHVPESYDPAVPAPLLVLFHSSLQSPAAMLQRTKVAEGAERRGFVVIVPDGVTYVVPGLGVAKTWEFAERLRAYSQVDRVIDALCLDRSQVFTFGHVEGGFPAHAFDCESEFAPAGEASSGFRYSPKRGPCGQLAIPSLAISYLDDPSEPAEGGPGCLDSAISSDARSIADHERVLREHYSCTGSPETTEPRDGVCQEWRCRARLQTCRVRGGRQWEDRSPFVQKHCGGEPSKFDVMGRVWQFFDDVRKQR